MDEDITIINATTRNEKIKNFFVNNKKKLAISLSLIKSKQPNEELIESK